MFTITENSYSEVKESFFNFTNKIDLPVSTLNEIEDILSNFYMLKTVNKYEIVFSSIHISLKKEYPDFELHFLLKYFLQLNVHFSISNIRYAITFIIDFSELGDFTV
jgi:hypothetical protein